MNIRFLFLFILSNSIVFSQQGDNTQILQNYLQRIEQSKTREQILSLGNEAVAKLGSRSVIHTAMGNTFMEIKDYNNAVNSYRSALSLNPRSAVSYNRLGMALLRIAYYRQAEVAFKSAVAYVPLNSPASLQYQAHIALALENQKDLVQAQQIIHNILKINPNFVPALEIQERIKK